MGSHTQSCATVGILSIGDMGLGVARLLMAHNYRVLTNVSDRGTATQARATKNNIPTVATDLELVEQSDYILSIVPPRDAQQTAQRIATASKNSSTTRSHPLVFLDLNAISPATARGIRDLFATSPGANVTYLDGGIIGGPPRLVESTDENTSTNESSNGKTASWDQPSIPLSGPVRLDTLDTPSAAHLAQTLAIRHVEGGIGAATGLKMCFAALSKGFTALAIQSFTTAQSLGVLSELKAELAEHNPSTLRSAERGLPGMCPKAYRWVREMEEIAATMESDGGFAPEESSFRSVARVYDLVANGTVLGEEKVGERQRGTTSESVAELIAESTRQRKMKTE